MSEKVNNPEKKVTPEFVSYNLFGLRPVTSVYQIDTEKFSNLIFDISSREIDGVEEVTYEIDYKTGQVRWYLWFNSNSEHFVDKSTNDTAIRAAISRYSDDFVKFAKKFGYYDGEDDPKGASDVKIKKIMSPNTNREVGRKLTAMQIAITPYLLTIFDMHNTVFTKTYGVNPPKCKLRRSWKYTKGSKGDFNNIAGIIIEKTLASAMINREKPVAKRSGNF